MYVINLRTWQLDNFLKGSVDIINFSDNVSISMIISFTALDPFGHMTTECYKDWLKKGW